MQKHPKNYSKSANRALDVLDYFARVGGAARASDIADALGIARSSTDQLLKSMVLSGYLVLSAEGRSYFPSMRMARFGHWISDRYPDVERYRAIIDDVHAQTGEVVTLSMQNDCFMQLMSSASDNGDDPVSETGGRVPVLGSAIGSAALAAKPLKAVARLMERAHRQHAMIDGTERDAAYVEQIRLFRMKGYSWRATRRQRAADGRTDTSDYWSIAMTLPCATGTPDIVLGLAGPTRRVRSREWELVNLMRRSIRLNLAS